MIFFSSLFALGFTLNLKLIDFKNGLGTFLSGGLEVVLFLWQWIERAC